MALLLLVVLGLLVHNSSILAESYHRGVVSSKLERAVGNCGVPWSAKVDGQHARQAEDTGSPKR